MAQNGLAWHSDVTLDVVCERLWDVARLAYVNSGEVLNYSATIDFEDDQNKLPLPLDAQPLRDIVPPENPNIICYTRRDGKTLSLPAFDSSPEVLFIGEDTPLPAMPGAQARRRHLVYRRVNPSITSWADSSVSLCW